MSLAVDLALLDRRRARCSSVIGWSSPIVAGYFAKVVRPKYPPRR